jgi:formate/nitrite transporter FocA (FNT family)
MYYIPTGILAKADPIFVEQAVRLGAGDLAHLSWYSFLVKNLFPVTLGNIVGGGFFVGIIYWFTYRSQARA